MAFARALPLSVALALFSIPVAADDDAGKVVRPPPASLPPSPVVSIALLPSQHSLPGSLHPPTVRAPFLHACLCTRRCLRAPTS